MLNNVKFYPKQMAELVEQLEYKDIIKYPEFKLRLGLILFD